MLRAVRARRTGATRSASCPQLFPELFTGGVGPQGAAPYDYDPDNPSTTKFPPYYDGSFILGEFTQDTLREVRLDSQNRVFKINQSPELRRRTDDRRHVRSCATTRWTWSSGLTATSTC